MAKLPGNNFSRRYSWKYRVIFYIEINVKRCNIYCELSSALEFGEADEDDDEQFMRNVQQQLNLLKRMNPGVASDSNILDPPSGFATSDNEEPREGSPSPPAVVASPKRTKLEKCEARRVSFKSPVPDEVTVESSEDDDVFVHEIPVNFSSTIKSDESSDPMSKSSQKVKDNSISKCKTNNHITNIIISPILDKCSTPETCQSPTNNSTPTNGSPFGECPDTVKKRPSDGSVKPGAVRNLIACFNNTSPEVGWDKNDDPVVRRTPDILPEKESSEAGVIGSFHSVKASMEGNSGAVSEYMVPWNPVTNGVPSTESGNESEVEEVREGEPDLLTTVSHRLGLTSSPSSAFTPIRKRDNVANLNAKCNVLSNVHVIGSHGSEIPVSGAGRPGSYSWLTGQPGQVATHSASTVPGSTGPDSTVGATLSTVSTVGATTGTARTGNSDETQGSSGEISETPEQKGTSETITNLGITGGTGISTGTPGRRAVGRSQVSVAGTVGTGTVTSTALDGTKSECGTVVTNGSTGTVENGTVENAAVIASKAAATASHARATVSRATATASHAAANAVRGSGVEGRKDGHHMLTRGTKVTYSSVFGHMAGGKDDTALQPAADGAVLPPHPPVSTSIIVWLHSKKHPKTPHKPGLLNQAFL